jgi:hypothetical protein
VEPSDRVKQRRFATAGRADHDGDFAGRHIECAVVDRKDANPLDAVHLDGVNNSDATLVD